MSTNKIIIQESHNNFSSLPPTITYTTPTIFSAATQFPNSLEFNILSDLFTEMYNFNIHTTTLTPVLCSENTSHNLFKCKYTNSSSYSNNLTDVLAIIENKIDHILSVMESIKLAFNRLVTDIKSTSK